MKRVFEVHMGNCDEVGFPSHFPLINRQIILGGYKSCEHGRKVPGISI